MNQGLAVVIGLSIAYIASIAGMIFAYLHYKKYKDKGAPHTSSPERGQG
jgi:H+/gluconate symporter-like permease